MPADSLIGRDRELAELEARAKDNRLVTVVGPGGVGKTALARAVAARLADRYAAGMRVVDLTRVDDDSAVPGAIAGHLGFDSFDALLSSPNDRPVLLLVDNCEHLLDTVASSIVQVLGACNQPTVVATSRAPLEVPGESIVSLAPLGVPADDGDPLTCASVQLFLERCRDAGAQVSESDLPMVVELCRRLDGLPLAIEIAAARARTMSVAEIAARLDESVEVLGRPRFRGDPRHRSVRDTIRWSYDLLAPSQARLLEQLGVFVGPFTRDSVRAVVPPEHADTLDDDLDDLVNASLVVAVTEGPVTRYRLLDTVRRFAIEELQRHDDFDAAHDRFVDHVVAWVDETIAGSGTAWRPALVAELVGAFEDIAEALRWSIGHDESPRRAYRLCSVLWAIVHQGHADDIADLARRTLDRWPHDGSPAAAHVAAVLATAEYVTGHPDRAVSIASHALAKMSGEGAASITLHRVLGQARRALGDVPGSLAAFERGARIGHELGAAAAAQELEIAAALVKADDGDADTAIRLLEDVLARAQAIDSVITLSWGRSVLGWVMLRTDPSAARTVIDAALTEARGIDYPIAVAVNLRSRAYAELLAGDHAAAIATATELMRDLIARGALSNARLLLDVTAAIAFRVGYEGWERLAATARSLPITTLASAQFELVPVPPTAAPPVGRYDAIGAAWNALAEMSASPSGRARDAHAPAPSTGVIRRSGDVCEFSFADRSVTLRTTKGVENLIQLIEAQGRELHCLDLIGAGVEERSTGDVIDDAARRDYEQRIRDLQAEIDEAEVNSDYARAYRHQAELDALVEHLTAALGRGNRTRRGTDSTERARSAVTHRLRTTVKHLGRLHTLLGRHLEHAVNTGIYCSYRPEHPTVWRIE